MVNALEVGEPHLDPLAFTARPLVGLGADPRPRHVAGTFIDAARDPAKRRLRTAYRFEVALGAVDDAAAIEDGVPVIDASCRGQRLAAGASIGIWALVVAEFLGGDRPVLALGLIEDGDVRSDPLLRYEPV